MPLSQVMAYNTEHLIDASAHWQALADQREEVFGAVHNEARSLPWEGQGAEALRTRTAADYGTALNSAENLRAASMIAKDGASTLTQMHSRVMYTVEDMQADGFAPTEELGAVDTRPSTNPAVAAQRQAQAQQYAAQLKSQVADLYSHDAQVGADMSNATADEGKIQFVDHTFKQGPDQPGDPGRHPDYPDHKPNGKWAPGNSGADGDAAAKNTFDNMERRGIPLERQEIQVKVTDPKTGQTYTRYYDALRPTGEPGKYAGLEHKVNESPITPNQRTFDGIVNSGTPAEGTLNGKPIQVTSAEEIRVPWPPPDAAGKLPGEPVAPRAPIAEPIPEAPPPAAALRPEPGMGGFGGGPSINTLPHFVDPRIHHQPHIIGDWAPDPEEIP
jgi:hypothetical protein